MLKKILLFICLLSLISINVSALKSTDEFYEYNNEPDKVAKILGMTVDRLEGYVEDTDITYLAINKDNTKQIKKCEYIDDFSQKVQSFWSLSDEEILALSEDLSGIKNISGQIVEKGECKYLKITAKTSDSGGEYILTQYITVDKGKNQFLSFYTAANVGTDYIEEYFNSQLNEAPFIFKAAAVVGTILFSLLALVVLIAIIKDTFWRKANATV